MRNESLETVLRKLTEGKLAPDAIADAIVRLGKPYNENQIQAAKEVVARYLQHKDAWVRHEAMWFLSAWGKLPEYQSALITALERDDFVDNRAYAAECLANLKKGSHDRKAIAALTAAVQRESEDEFVRKSAYLALLNIVNGDASTPFDPHDSKMTDIDWEWVRGLL